MKEFLENLKELAKTCFILFQDTSNEIAIIKEKIVKLDEPKNVLHVFSTLKGYTADYVETAKEQIGMDKLYKTIRQGKNLFLVHPVIAGILFHFCERIAQKTINLKKSYKGKNLDAQIIKETACDRLNMGKFLCKDLVEMIVKDNPKIKLTARNSLTNYLIVKDVEKGIVSFQILGK